MRAIRFAAGGVVVCSAVAGISLGTGACGSDTPETPDGAVLDGGDSPSDAPPVNCPSGKEPKDDPTCVTNDVGVFVSATGSDANAGTKEKPLATLGAALTRASGAGKGKIFVCEGSYTESVEIKATVGVYGGFKCSDWSYSGTKPKFAGAKPDYVVKVDGASGVTLADLELDGKDGAPNSGESSIALFVNLAQSVTVSRSALAAGIGAKGADGVLVPYSFPQQSDLNGKAADGGTGGAANPYTCPDGQKTTGGKGADIINKNGDNGLPALDGGAGGTAVGCLSTNTGGGNGSPAANSPPATPSNAFGQLSANWVPAPGPNGASGSPGQGGGGGGSTSGAGGGGGAGGCGGAGGPGGKGGGASIALLSIGSTSKLIGSTLVTKNAGMGGTGVAGQTGQTSGGFGGLQTPPGCTGGGGGAGGAGGAGAGGAGGVSVGVLYKGTKPDIDLQTMGAIVTGTKGTKGTGGAGNDGIDGVAQAVLECVPPGCL